MINNSMDYSNIITNENSLFSFSPIKDLMSYLYESENFYNNINIAFNNRAITSLQETGEIQPLNEEEKTTFFSKIVKAIQDFLKFIRGLWDKFTTWVKGLFGKSKPNEQAVEDGAKVYAEAKKKNKKEVTPEDVKAAGVKPNKESKPEPEKPKSEKPKQEPEKPKPEESKPKPEKPKSEPEKPKSEKPKQEPEKPKSEPEPEKPKPEPEKPKSEPVITLKSEPGYLHDVTASFGSVRDALNNFFKRVEEDGATGVDFGEQKIRYLKSMMTGPIYNKDHITWDKEKLDITTIKSNFEWYCKGKYVDNIYEAYSKSNKGAREFAKAHMNDRTKVLEIGKNNFEKYCNEMQIHCKKSLSNATDNRYQKIYKWVQQFNNIFATVYSVQVKSTAEFIKIINKISNYFESLGVKAQKMSALAESSVEQNEFVVNSFLENLSVI